MAPAFSGKDDNAPYDEEMADVVRGVIGEIHEDLIVWSLGDEDDGEANEANW